MTCANDGLSRLTVQVKVILDGYCCNQLDEWTSSRPREKNIARDLEILMGMTKIRHGN